MIILLNTCKEIKSRSHHMRNMIIFELLQREFLLQGQHTCGYQRAGFLVFIEETEKQENGLNKVTKLHIRCARLYLVLFM